MLKLTPLPDGGPLALAGVADLPPDLVWLTLDGREAGPGEPGVRGDFALAVTEADGPAGDLRAANPLRSPVIHCLFTDAPCEAWQLKPEHGGDFRGWPGDGFGVDAARGEQPMGSYFWLYRREVLTEDTAYQVAAEAERALAPLLRQGAVARIEASATADFLTESVRLSVGLYARDGARLYAPQFDLLWRRADGRL